MPGLGEWYVGRYARGVIFFILGTLIAVPVIALAINLTHWVFIVGTAVLAALRVWTVVDAYVVAKLVPPQPRSWGRRAGVVAVFITGVVISDMAAVWTRTTIAEPFHVPSGSMIPTLLVGDYFLLDRRAYIDRTPRVGDVVVFERPGGSGELFVQRIVAGPGDHLSTGGVPPVLSINGTATGLAARGSPSLTLGADQYFTVGDNANNSFDSRMFGPVGRDAIHGKARYIHFSREPERCAVRWGRIGMRLD